MSDGQRGGVAALAPANLCPRADAELTDCQLLERFAQRQDAAAFATLIQRHGPMVLGVCRRVLSHAQEAEDAFQMTFLVLVRRAGSIQQPERLGNWLYGVAYRTAHKARARLARRRHHERQVEPMSPSDPHADLHWQELRSVLDDELQQLPAKYRTPLVLCYLEGLTNEEAARRLGWPTGSMSYRLARGRKLLGDRLRQRRQMYSGVILLALLRRHAGPEDVPDDLAQSTLHLALDFAPARPLPDPPPVSVTGPFAPTAAATPRVRPMLLALLVGVAAMAVAGFLYLALTDGFGGWGSNGSRSPGNATTPGSCH
jgi:RNA polymerase sigma factor (sigma-70 family)